MEDNKYEKAKIHFENCKDQVPDKLRKIKRRIKLIDSILNDNENGELLNRRKQIKHFISNLDTEYLKIKSNLDLARNTTKKALSKTIQTHIQNIDNAFKPLKGLHSISDAVDEKTIGLILEKMDIIFTKTLEYTNKSSKKKLLMINCTLSKDITLNDIEVADFVKDHMFVSFQFLLGILKTENDAHAYRKLYKQAATIVGNHTMFYEISPDIRGMKN